MTAWQATFTPFLPETRAGGLYEGRTPQPGSLEEISREIKPKSATIRRRGLDKPRPPELEMRIADGDTIHLGAELGLDPFFRSKIG